MELTKVGLKGADIASASTITPDGSFDRFDVTGTTGISAIHTDERGVGARFYLRFTGILTLTHGADLALAGSIDATTSAGEVLLFEVTGDDAVRQIPLGRATSGGGGGSAGSFDVAGAPDPASYVGATGYCTDGASGTPCGALSDGTNWLRFVLGAAISGVPFDPTPYGTVSLWLAPFDPGTGSTWNDSSTNTNTGTLEDSAAWGAAGVDMTGAGEYVGSFGAPISPAGSPRAIFITATSNDATFARAGLVGTRASNSPGGFVFAYYSATQIQYFCIGGGTFRPTVSMPASGTKNVWCLMHNGSTVTIYLNGTQVATTGAFAGDDAADGNGHIGKEQEGFSSESWNGTIHNVLIYSTVVSPTDIATISAALA